MPVEPPLRLPAWRDGQRWTYELARLGKDGFRGRLIYTAQRLPDGAWRIEGVSEYPGERSLHEWVELAGEPVRQRAAFFERHNAEGLYRYEAAQAEDGSLTVTEQSGPFTHEEQHGARQGAVYLNNQFDFLLHGLAIDQPGPWRFRGRVEGGKVYPFEIAVAAREAPLVVGEESVPATLVTVRVGGNPLVRALAPTARYWFHPRDQTALLRMENGPTVLTLEAIA